MYFKLRYYNWRWDSLVGYGDRPLSGGQEKLGSIPEKAKTLFSSP
jgi:hypothetical protein